MKTISVALEREETLERTKNPPAPKKKNSNYELRVKLTKNGRDG